MSAVNIGLYHVASNANTAAFFTGLNLYMQKNPLAFDQQVFQQCIERTYDVVKSKMNPMDKLNPKLARDYPVECTTKDHLSKKGQHCCPVSLSISENLKYHMIDSNVIVCADPPQMIAGKSIAAHVLTGKPLTGAIAKQVGVNIARNILLLITILPKVIAKELMLWEGTNNYYDSPHAKYIMLEANQIELQNIPERFGNAQNLAKVMMTYLMILALGTGRIPILPAVRSHFGFKR